VQCRLIRRRPAERRPERAAEPACLCTVQHDGREVAVLEGAEPDDRGLFGGAYMRAVLVGVDDERGAQLRGEGGEGAGSLSTIRPTICASWRTRSTRCSSVAAVAAAHGGEAVAAARERGSLVTTVTLPAVAEPRGAMQSRGPLQCRTAARGNTVGMTLFVGILISVVAFVSIAVVFALFVWAARKDGEEDEALQRRLGIRRKTRIGL
jgi:hypothetical protein